MMTPMRYICLVFFVILSLHFIMTVSHEEYGRATSFSSLNSKWRNKPEPPRPKPVFVDEDVRPAPARKANATFVILARNADLNGVMESIRQLEDRFNRHYHYPYVFLNEKPFSEEFKRWTSNLASGTVEYGLIPKSHWEQPSHINEELAKAAREKMVQDQVIYGGSVAYRNMCRFNSGYFFRHPLLLKYRYYWRVEPGIKYFCDMDNDPFLFMQDNDKVYGFTLSLYEYQRTIPTLWDATRQFIKENPQYLPKDNAMAFISDDGGRNYNLCHFWSNFEIGNLDFWRSEAYTKYFEYLDLRGGFYYERWGDAPVHSLGVALFARKDQIHFFKEIGYRHEPFQHCPQGDTWMNGKCWCDPKDTFDYIPYSCTYRYDRMF
ncbi:probable mannosyltransferase involved in N-linked and O-linked glycosylation [Serendipita indica DSM 11827]|uniref:Probable mannosyltransferase involved in N-linked and O-linked glycosylation n=1 Tax=Serendipita indica (strain DSM 11827) TaxID=1109443 RepID=G4U2I2_SERID|nr:probable mannosyltransferase involved in N-linked and O-linked glycosylation [Serendipita indica DSM 11827]